MRQTCWLRLKNKDLHLDLDCIGTYINEFLGDYSGYSGGLDCQYNDTLLRESEYDVKVLELCQHRFTHAMSGRYSLSRKTSFLKLLFLFLLERV